MTTPTTPSSAGLVSLLAWIIPISGIIIWVFILPSTRALLRHKAESFAKRKTATAAPETAEGSTPESAAPTGPRLRSEDPEIKRFDREVVRTKFANSPHAKTRTD